MSLAAVPALRLRSLKLPPSCGLRSPLKFGAGARRGKIGWEADERPEPRSLGLLPSGPDPVGEWLVHRQPPMPYIGRCGVESKLGRFGQRLATVNRLTPLAFCG